MTKRIVDFKSVEMTDEEYDYYLELVNQFTSGNYLGKEQFRDVFDVDADGCISIIRPPLNKQIGWSVLVFLQNLMINQRLRRMEQRISELINGRNSNN